ncbi:MAG: arsenic resistance N-acetyltransferase ArsN2 [Desulfobulbia bacterium]
MTEPAIIGMYSTSDKKSVLDLLKKADLPVEDLTDTKLKHFMIAKSDDRSVIGVVGVEVHQESGLLRSLVVHPFYRDKGLGHHLVGKIVSYAQQKGIRTLYLLTMTAADFFPKMGFEVTLRDQVPASIINTDEFKNVCPATAVCLSKKLGAFQYR